MKIQHNQFTKWQLWAQYLQAHDAKGETPTLSKGEFFKLPDKKKAVVVSSLKAYR